MLESEGIPIEQRCELCDGSGLVVTENGGSRSARECVCRRAARERSRILRANVPALYSRSSLDSFTLLPEMDISQRQALFIARGYVADWPLDQGGLLFTGMVGTGKTHLAVGILRAVMIEKGATARFYYLPDLLKRMQNTYGPGAAENESAILDELAKSDLIVMDELGGGRVTEWSYQAIELIVGRLYNRNANVIFTTNLLNAPPGTTDENPVRSAVREETLGDRIGARVHSRLQGMCRTVEMRGPDFRIRGR
jgi:DNA replication protein DnaC